MIKVLLANPDFCINEINPSGMTALMIAAKKGYVDIVKELLTRKDINVNLKNKRGKTALDLAATDEIRRLLQSESEKQSLINETKDAGIVGAS